MPPAPRRSKTGANKAKVNAAGQLATTSAVTGSVAVTNTVKASVTGSVTGSVNATAVDSTVQLYNGRTCTTAGSNLVTLNTAGYKQIRVFVRNNDSGASRSWRLNAVLSDGVANLSYPVASGVISATNVFTGVIELPGTALSFDCLGVIVPNGMSLHVMGRRN